MSRTLLLYPINFMRIATRLSTSASKRVRTAGIRMIVHSVTEAVVGMIRQPGYPGYGEGWVLAAYSLK
jgi:hypothetical protein